MATASTGSPEPMSEKQSFSERKSAVVTSCALSSYCLERKAANKECKISKLGNRIIELSLIEK